MKSIYYHNEYVGCHACYWDRRDNPRGGERECHFEHPIFTDGQCTYWRNKAHDPNEKQHGSKYELFSTNPSGCDSEEFVNFMNGQP